MYISLNYVPGWKNDKLPSLWPNAIFPSILWCQRNWQMSDMKPCASLWVVREPLEPKFHTYMGPLPLTNEIQSFSCRHQPTEHGLPFVLSNRAMTFCCATFQMMTVLSEPALAKTSGSRGFHDMAVIVFLCSDITDTSLNSLNSRSNWKKYIWRLIRPLFVIDLSY